MKMLTNRSTIVIMFYTLLSLVSCKKEIQRVEEERVPIAISVENIQTKASIFDTPASINNPEVGGGDFALYAFVSGNSSSTGNMYMDHARVNYFSDARRWRFADENGMYFNYFWPLDEHLDFFGHFPLNAEDAGVTKVTYTYEDGPSFEYSLPLHSYDESAARNASLVASDTRNQEGLYEFMYSFVQDQSVETQNADPSDPGVKMHFSHPFAAVSFHLDHAYRMTLHEIVLSEIKYKGNYSYDLSAGEWSMSEGDAVGDLWIEVEKGIPTPINFNSPIGGPYIVAPQDLKDGSNLSVTYTRLDAHKETKHVQLNSLGVVRWEAGKHYVYTLSMGNNNEEILFKVKVDAWDIIDYKNEIDVE